MIKDESLVDRWSDISWPKAVNWVLKLQTRIYHASKRGDRKQVHNLQKLLLHSQLVACVAVWRVTQRNSGKNSAGVDGVARLTPEQKLALAHSLDLEPQAQPTRRIWIPKANSDEKRPLGIPAMRDRAIQTLALMALEPEWEAKFEPNSFGFRPGRCQHDGLCLIQSAIALCPRYVLDADITKCFDRINHQELLRKLDTFPTIRRLIRAWLQAGFLDDGKLLPTEMGTPQGGIISPMLMNVTLHGLETAIISAFPASKTVGGRRLIWRPIVVRFADDFVVLHRDREVILQCRDIANHWLHGIGLELSEKKTRIVHTLNREDGKCGFTFLGLKIWQRRTGKYGTPKMLNQVLTLIEPSPDSLKRHYKEIAEVISACDALSQEALIGKLNPKIRGWTNYFRRWNSRRAFSKLDRLLFLRLWRWAKRRHTNKGTDWRYRKYWPKGSPRRFRSSSGPTLTKYSDAPIEHHVKIQSDRSPYDGDWAYWASRRGYHPSVSKSQAILLRRQNGRCAECGLAFGPDERPDDTLAIRFLDGNTGNRRYANQALLHRQCAEKRRSHSEPIGEEPDEVKVSCPVLKTSGACEGSTEFNEIT